MRSGAPAAHTLLHIGFAALVALGGLLLSAPEPRSAWAQEAPALDETLPSPAETLPEPALPAGPAGVASLVDDRGLLDRVEIRIQGLTPPPDGAVYRAWLRSDDETMTQLVGDLAFDEVGDAVVAWSQTAGEPLFIQFSETLITLETGPIAQGPAGPLPGEVVLRGQVDPGALTHFRRLMVRWPDSRYGTASMQGLRQLSAAMHFHAAILREAAVLGDLETVRRKAEHVVNIIEGQAGGFYGDHDGNGRAEDPGDGVGLLSYGWGALTHTQFAWATARDEVVAEAALAVQPPILTGLEWAGFARQVALELTAPYDAGGAPQTAEGALELAGHLFAAAERLVVAVDPHWSETLTAQAIAEQHVPAYDTALALLQVPLTPSVSTTASASPGQARS